MAAQELFLEIGTEELPASTIAPAVQELAATLHDRLSQALIAFGAIETFGTPRRLGVVIQGVAPRGEDRKEEVTGPPTRIAFHDDGSPRVPAQKFAEKVGLPLDKLERKETPKGEYLVAQQVEEGVDTLAFLNEILPDVLGGLSFPKTMRWGAVKTAFARPIHWLCARLGDTPLSFSFAAVDSGVESRGHRFLAPDAFVVESYAQYKDACRERYVLLDAEERKAIIAERGQALAQSVGGELWADDELIERNAYLTEYPVPLLAHFEEHYLALPKELLRTSMKQHLKCFAIVDSDGALMPHFLPVANQPFASEDKVRDGFQRVLRARLADAEFFFKEDSKKSLEVLNQKLDNVIYQSKLGTYGDKVRRVQSLVEGVAKEVGRKDATAHAQRAAALYKADLSSQMVYEFPELQGIMGRTYALQQGEPKEVAAAIEEHYLPAGQDDPVPASDAGVVLAIAERLDTLVGGFGAGLKPTGSADPYGLRRQAIGLLRILKEHKLPGRIAPLLELTVPPLSDCLDDPKAVKDEVLDYLLGRLVQIWRADGWPKDQVDAVCVAELIARYPLVDLEKLLAALGDAVQSGVLAGLAYSFKRVNNILRAAAKKNEVEAYTGLGTLLFREDAPAIDESLLEEGPETALYEIYHAVRETVREALDRSDFAQGLHVLQKLQDPIDNLFDNVMVMAKDKALRANRLLLMRGIARLAFLDFSRIDTDEAEG